MEICLTRFNNITLNENIIWKEKNNIKCIYGSPVKITDKILPNSTIIVIEMNNTKNIIEGFGIIKNKLTKENKRLYDIYTDKNYNRYIYKSNLRIDKTELNDYQLNIIKNLEKLLFTTKSHCKRGQGIQIISSKIKNNKDYNYINFIRREIINCARGNLPRQ